jgi:hypothetical protein
MSGWSTIESDPGVFTRLSRDIGIRGTQVEEVWDLDDQVIVPTFRAPTETSDTDSLWEHTG